jgi:hypothetical protein
MQYIEHSVRRPDRSGTSIATSREVASGLVGRRCGVYRDQSSTTPNCEHFPHYGPRDYHRGAITLTQHRPKLY